jgi:hypothetical protein
MNIIGTKEVLKMANLTDWGESIKVPDSLLEKVDLCVKCGRHESRTSLVIEAIELWLENDELFNGAVIYASDADNP